LISLFVLPVAGVLDHVHVPEQYWSKRDGEPTHTKGSQPRDPTACSASTPKESCSHSMFDMNSKHTVSSKSSEGSPHGAYVRLTANTLRFHLLHLFAGSRLHPARIIIDLCA